MSIGDILLKSGTSAGLCKLINVNSNYVQLITFKGKL